MKSLAIWCCLCLLPALLTAQTQVGLAPKKSMDALRITDKIKIDGVLDESIWSQAAAVEGFVHRWPTPGKPATERTVVRVLYDDNAIYVCAYCYDRNPDSIFHRITKRDELENTDLFSVIFDTYRDGQNALQFGVTPDNVQFDSKFSLANANADNGNADGEDPAWDAVWVSSARITADGWVAELKIPYAALRFPKKQVQQWSVNFERVVKRRNETDTWNEVKAEMTGSLNQMGILNGITNIKAPIRLSATPFVAAYANNTYNQSDGPRSTWSFPYSFGMDIKYGLNEAFTLDATIIPDFGQVRSDRNVLNLSPFEVRFQENRPFFTEGTELFNKGGLFYSRRVGANQQLLNATKISGRTKKGLGVGVFNAVAAAEYEENSEGLREQVAPLTNNSILVLDQNLPNNSSLTFISTNVLRSGSALDANVSGLLFSLKNKAQRYALSGKAVMSNRIGSVEETERGFTASLDVSKTSGNFLWGASTNIESDRYNPNDLGFLYSPNEISGLVWVNYNRYKPWWKLNNFWVSTWHWQGGLYKPFAEWTERLFGFNFGGNTKSFHNFGTNINYAPWGERDYFEPRTFDFKHYYHVPAYANFRAWYNSDNRKKLIYYANGGVRVFNETGRKSTSLYTGLRWRVSDKFTVGLEIGNEEAWNNVGGIGDGLQETAQGYNEISENDIIMGRRRINGFDNSVNATYAFTPTMNITVYSRHYWQKVRYSQFYKLGDDGQLIECPYTGQDNTLAGLHNVSANYFNIDLVYTWRFAPGSDLLIVYKNGIGHIDEARASEHNYFYNVGHLPDYSGSNNFSVKLLYFLDYASVKKKR
jgi:hypothetical protein